MEEKKNNTKSILIVIGGIIAVILLLFAFVYLPSLNMSQGEIILSAVVFIGIVGFFVVNKLLTEPSLTDVYERGYKKGYNQATKDASQGYRTNRYDATNKYEGELAEYYERGYATGYTNGLSDKKKQ